MKIFSNTLITIITIILLIGATTPSYAVDPINDNSNNNFHSVKAKNGDGVYSILRRYQLNSNSLNVQKFYTLNNLSKDQNLRTDKVYILPIKLYSYNGISIRSSIGDDDWDKAVRIQKYNEYLLENKLRKKSYRKSKILWVPFHELSVKESTKKEGLAKSTKAVKSNTAPALKKSENYEKLFGAKHGKFSKIDNSLQKQVYYVVSGHGGPDPGAQCLSCSNTMCEDEYAYDVALRLVRDLKQHGAIVHMIIQDENDGIRDDSELDCDKDETCMGERIPDGQLDRLKQRTASINTLYKKYKKQGIKNQKAIMIHVDSNHKNTAIDTYFYHAKNSKSGKKLAKGMQATFKAKYDKFQKGRGYKGTVKSRGLYMLRNTAPTAVYVELANIRNANDQKRLVKVENRQALANWLFEGLIK